MEVKVTYRDMCFRQPDGSIRTRRVPTYTVPEDFYDKAYMDWLKEHNPADYIESMHEIEEAFIATYFGG